MTIYGYARVSTADQDLTIQQEALKSAGCEIIRSEKVSGTSVKDRKELATLLEFIRSGDELIITRVDRLARSVFDLQTIVRVLQDKRVSLRATEQPIDTSSAAGQCCREMLSVFAEFAPNLRRDRQAEGIAKAKAEGKFRGRPASIDKTRIIELKESGLSATQISKEMGISRVSVYRAIKSVSVEMIE
jgi:DNA invertase Pin-like site-specific DNA recombinase